MLGWGHTNQLKGNIMAFLEALFKGLIWGVISLLINFISWFLGGWVILVLFNLSEIAVLAELGYMQVVFAGMAFSSAAGVGASLAKAGAEFMES
jgi:hypothetical protein